MVRKGRFFEFDAIINGRHLNIDEIESKLIEIKKEGDRLGWDPHPVGLLTSDDRDAWADVSNLVLSKGKNGFVEISK